MKPKLTTRISKYLFIVSTAIAVAFALIWIALQGYSAPWTGFGDFTKPNSDFTRGKTLWDWMQLFIIPIFLSVGVFLLNRSERVSERLRAEERAKLEREFATDRQQETALQSYLDRMADLLLKENLRTTENEEVRKVARTRTLTVLRGLDSARKGSVIVFLFEASLINGEKPVVNLKGASLYGANLQMADLKDINLQNTILSHADLSFANLQGADLQGADLSDAKLLYARLQGVSLQGAFLAGADLQMAQMQSAQLQRAHLRGANLQFVDLKGANLQDADLQQDEYLPAKLQRTFQRPRQPGANLQFADLKDANLQGAKLIGVNLRYATMPDGTKHD